jgi:hypothetical protein
MKQAAVVAEGKSDITILKHLLPEDIVKKVEFIEGQGRYSAQSLARSLLAVKRLPTALVVDTDTSDKRIIQEQEDFLQESLRQASPGVPFSVFLAIPEVEVLLLENPDAIEKLIHQKLSDADWNIARLQPKEFLSQALKKPLSTVEVKMLLENFGEQAFEAARNHPLVVRLGEFLSSVISAN